MTHPAIYLFTIGVAVGVALYAFFANAPEHTRSAGHHRSPHHKSCDFEFVDESQKCTICIDKITSDITYLDCGHVFHRRCVRKWLEMNDTCPNCKSRQTTRI